MVDVSMEAQDLYYIEPKEEPRRRILVRRPYGLFVHPQSEPRIPVSPEQYDNCNVRYQSSTSDVER